MRLKIWSLARVYASLAYRKYSDLHTYGKVVVWVVALFYACLGVFIIVATPSRIAQYLYDQAAELASMDFGWLWLLAALTIISFPPLVGYTTIVTLCGFAYGMNGFYIAVFGSVVGSTLSFSLLRFLFKERLRYWVASNKKWKALEEVVRTKGLPLIVLIRVSPFPPWVYSNSLFASIEPVKLWQFVVATLLMSPKLLLHVFIGFRIAALSDGRQRQHMDTQTKIINAVVIAGSLAVAIFSSWVVYNLVQGQIFHLKDVDELASEAREEFNEEMPLLDPVSNVPPTQA